MDLPILSRRTFLQAASAMALSQFGCASAQKPKNPQQYTPVTFELLPFQQYFPVPAPKTNLEDKLAQEYLENAWSINGLQHYTLKRSTDEKVEQIHIKDPVTFKANVILTARDLGFSEKDIYFCSIHDAIFLSGKIVAHKLRYDERMISPEQNNLINNPQALLGQLLQDNYDQYFEGKKVER